MFEPIDGYEQLLTGAHRKPAPVVRPPLLVWHLAFWADPRQPKDYSPPAATSEERRTARKTHIDEYLRHLYLRLHTHPVLKTSATPGVDEFQVQHAAPNHQPLFGRALDANGDFKPLGDPHRVPFGRDSQVVTYLFFWWGLRVTLRFEFHTEYLTISTHIDLSSHQDKDQFRKNSPVPVHALYDELERLNLNISEDKLALDDPKHYDPSVRLKYQTINEALYFTIWEEFFSKILRADQSEINRLGRVFADFRCLLLSKQAPAEYAAILAEKPWQNFQEPFWRRRGGPAPQDNEKPETKQGYWQERRAEFWPLLTANIRGVDFKRYEFTASQMLKGRALYITALGPQPAIDRGGERFPLCYFFYTYTLNGWQIGRLVDRINYLGTVRLAALIELEQLRDAALEIGDCERELKSAFSDAHKIRNAKKDSNGAYSATSTPDFSGVGASGESIEEVDARAMHLEKYLDRIGAKISSINEKFSGDIEYRIERSRYYVKQFNVGIAALRIRRLEGFQPYDVFIRRRLGAAFDSIDLLGIRYQRVRADMSALYQLYLAHESRAVQTATRDQNVEIEHIQAIADFALFAVLVPYYLGNLLEHIVWSNTEHHAPWWAWLLLFLGFLSFALIRAKKSIARACHSIWKRIEIWMSSRS
ncbi:type II toxin-antitoxin system HicB family antitoxin [Bradyrhizobium denitrificans]|uniref:type II toxin-antitoxin system HicB family antitoxin n=1 Tax=Bradyrhizobium denitrificans TaxID=2734912 RepID=UPI0003A485B4|nr:hypothetical protein [Bradyrhizobium denitrificans]MCL8489067.1 hypothetical protein [Bradyrhizobium denitrificans]